jgi:hypothetical protein
MVKFVLTSSRTIGALLWPSLKSYYPFVHCWQMQTHVSPLHLTVSNYVSRLFCYIFFHLLLPLSLRLLQLGCLTFLQSFSDSSHLSKTLLVMIPWSAAWVEIQLLLVGPICAKGTFVLIWKYCHYRGLAVETSQKLSWAHSCRDPPVSSSSFTYPF